MTNLLPAPEKLDLEGDNATVALRWEQWKRSFHIYLEASGITGEGRQRATLLLLGGPGLQEIVYNLPGAYEENSTNESQVFKTVIEKLDDYFLPKQNKIYERHLFRQIKQDEGEKFEKFVVKLRNQARKCKFTSPDEHIIDQIVEKCFSLELRKKILTLGDTVTLDKIITEANTLELVTHQLEEYGQKIKSNDINTITSRKKFTKTITSLQIIKLLKEIFSRLGYPSSITADNGRQFVSAKFKEYCRQCNIKLFNTIPYWPQQNGEVERQNRDILKRLKISHLQKEDLKESMWEYLMMYNSTPHSVTGKTPTELFFSRQNRDKIPSLLDNNSKINDSEVRDKDRMEKEKGKEYGDRKRHAEYPSLSEGDKVYVKDMEKGNKLSTTFKPTPHVVEHSDGGDVVVRNEETGQKLRRNVIHLKRVEGEWKVQDEGPGSESSNIE